MATVPVQLIEPRDTGVALTQDEEERVREYFVKLAAKSFMSAVTHPLTFAKTLFQLGYEPYPLTTGKVFVVFGREAYFLPNAFQYISSIYKEAGLKALFAGLDAAILSNAVGGITSFATELYLDRYFPDIGGAIKEQSKKEEEEISDHESFRLKLRQAIRTSIACTIGLIVSRPFTVMMVREIAQLVGRETKYASFMGALYCIGNEEGPRGFFSGLVPSILAQGVTIWGTFALTYVMERGLVRAHPDNEDENARKAIKDSRKVLSVIIPFFVNSFSYPFQVVSTIMSLNGSGLAVSLLPYSPSFNYWGDAYDYLKPHGLARGARLFLREQKGAVSVGPDHYLYASNKHFV